MLASCSGLCPLLSACCRGKGTLVGPGARASQAGVTPTGDLTFRLIVKNTQETHRNRYTVVTDRPSDLGRSGTVKMVSSVARSKYVVFQKLHKVRAFEICRF